MGCPTDVIIGDNLTFSICTHDPDTGVLTDADSVPTYRVYEDETTTAILTGSMAKLDDSNTTGFYTELIACTAANGFEDGKTYTIYIQAVIDGDTGGICYGFAAHTHLWSWATRTLTQSAASVVSVVSGTTLTCTRGDTLVATITGLGDISDRDSLWFTAKLCDEDEADAASLIQIEETGGLLYINATAAGTAANGSITVDDAAAGDITVTLDEVETAKLDILSSSEGATYDVQVRTTAGVVTTLTKATFVVSSDVTRATS